MDVKLYGNEFVGIKLDRGEYTVVVRAANASIRALGRELVSAVAVPVNVKIPKFFGRSKAESARTFAENCAVDELVRHQTEGNALILAIGAITKRLVDNVPPTYLEEIPEDIIASIRQEGHTILDESEVGTMENFLTRYAHSTFEAVESYTGQVGLNTAWERAYYGDVAEKLSTQLTDTFYQRPNSIS
jgi:hypothetical protein